MQKVLKAKPEVAAEAGSASKDPAGTRVLGRETLREVRNDMRATVLPSWMNAGPSHPGETKWGKMKADEWRVFCSVHLPITLIRLWGSANESEREHEILTNFMHLVTAVDLASRRELKDRHIHRYEKHIVEYLKTLLILYPGTTLVPNQHRSLHYGVHLRRWGPSHAWRCFAFERYNGLLQNLFTNSIFGEITAQ